MRRLARVTLLIALVAVALAGVALALLWHFQERLLFHPQPLPADHRFEFGPDVHELGVQVPGARLSVLQLRLPDPKGVVFFLHGNAGNLQGWFGNVDFYRAANYDLVMPDYRGFGKSTGRIDSEAQLREDVRAVWREVAARYAGRKVVIYGRSLGTALATGLAAELGAHGTPADLTVLATPYSSIRELASEMFPAVPSVLVRYPLDTVALARDIRGPILLFHGDRDELIPLRHSERIAAALPQARLVVVSGAHHNDIHEFGAYRSAFAQALRAL